MNKKSATIIEFVQAIREELADMYEENELNSFIFLMFGHYAGLAKTDIVLKAAEILEAEALSKIQEAVDRLKKHEPIQHILGSTEFYGLAIKTDRRAMIPRPETEELADWIIKDNDVSNAALAKSDDRAPRILDIGTGTGCIALALKSKIDRANITAIDNSMDALTLAKENSLVNKLDIRLYKANILKWRDDEQLSALADFDIIVSNPPYIERRLAEEMQKNVLDYEPCQALFVDDGEPLVFYEAIIELAKEKLSVTGALYFEISEREGEHVVALLKENGFQQIELKKDLSGKDRMVSSKKI